MYKSQIRGLLSARGKVQFKFFFFGILIYGVISCLLGFAFGDKRIYVYISDIVVIAVMVSILWPLLHREIESLSSPDDQFEQRKSANTAIFTVSITQNLLICAFGGVLLALFSAYAWASFKLFRVIEDLLEDTFMEGFTFVPWVIIWFAVLIGIIMIPIEVNNWWTKRKDKICREDR